MTNEERAEELIKKYRFDFNSISKIEAKYRAVGQPLKASNQFNSARNR